MVIHFLQKHCCSVAAVYINNESLFATASSIHITYTLSILCWDLQHTLHGHRQGPFVE
jgi:hypothetical protein